MSITSLKRSRAKVKTRRAKELIDTDLIWDRPPDWPQLPQVLASESKFVGLVKIEDHDMNHVTLTMGTPSGTWNVDWGDGTTSTGLAAGATASHSYTYSDVALGAATSEGFKTAIVVATPNTGGVNFNTIGLNTKHSSFGGNSGLATPWLEMRMSMPGITSSANFAIGNGASVFHKNVRNFEYVGALGVTNCTNMFIGYNSLEQLKVSRSFTTACTNASSMFQGLIKLKYLPDLDLSNVTTFSLFLSGCVRLRRLPELNISSATVISSMFANCSSLEYIPDMTTGTLTSMASTFSGCNLLKVAPAISNTGSVTSMSNMFLNCFSLMRIPVYTSTSVTSIAAMFSGCGNLEIVPALNWASVTTGNTTNLFTGCNSLRKILATGLRFGHTIPSQLSSAALDVYYTNLGTASGAQTLVVSGNATATDTPSIATAKGWTVTGS